MVDPAVLTADEEPEPPELIREIPDTIPDDLLEG
jgi:hypothetical protein